LLDWRRCTINDTALLLFVGLACLMAGYLVGKVNSGGQPEQKPEGDKHEKSPRQDMVEAGRIWRNIRSGDFYPELDGKVFRSPSEMTNDQQARFTRLLQVLQSWVKPPAGKPATVESPLLGEAVGVAIEGTESMVEEKKISYNPIKAFTDVIGVEINKPASTHKSIVAQVDEILQEKLENTPLAKQGISMRDSPDGGLLVWVGLQQYNSIDEVPDQGVRQLLRESVEEWERRVDK
jgi:hypothetical protein